MSDPNGWLGFLNGVTLDEVEVGEFKVPTPEEIDPRRGLWADDTEVSDE